MSPTWTEIGNVRGPSAYELAVAGGFTGTLADWIASLEGDVGRPVELGRSATHLQWRVQGDPAWLDLVPLADITGPKGDPGDEVSLQKSATHVQWRLGTDPWVDLVPLTDLTGPQGDPGDQVELRKTATDIEWRLAGGAWAVLTSLASITGPKGDKGDTGDTTDADSGTWAAGTYSIPGATGPYTRSRTLSGNITLTAPANGLTGKAYTSTLSLKQAAAGGPFTVTWPATLEWAGDAPAPVMPTAANAELIVHLFWTGTAWRAMLGGVFYP